MQKNCFLLCLLLSLLAPTYCLAAEVTIAPRLNVLEPMHHFGELTPGQVVSHDFIIQNTGNADLIIHQITASCICSKTILGSPQLKAGEQTVLKVYFDTTHKPLGEFQGKLEVFSNDPEQLVTQLRIKAQIVKTPASPTIEGTTTVN